MSSGLEVYLRVEDHARRGVRPDPLRALLAKESQR
jgi:hypothetical protein